MIVPIMLDELEIFVPSFKNPSNAIFTALGVYFERASQYLEEFADGFSFVSDERGLMLAKRYVYNRAAYLAVPSLDLVLTGSGFGVVSNSNLAPASPGRVAALRESLRQEYGRAFDAFADYLSRTAWTKTERAKRYYSALFPSARVLREHGVTLAPETPPYTEEDLRAMWTKIALAQTDVEGLVSPELVEFLCQFARCEQSEPDGLEMERAFFGLNKPIYQKALFLVRQLVALRVQYPNEDHRPNSRALLRFVQKNENTLVEFRLSQTRKAQKNKTYQNRKDDAAFFFA